MARPRLIILVRHAQSEGNKNRGIHQTVPDHRVKLTPDGHQQALEAGRRLRSMLRPDDKIQFFTSPYRRTRETTEGILTSLTSDDPAPSPFRRHSIKVYEEPRLREQDFGNFQPCSAEMERMWQERAEYGHFFYRIPNGESAADAYDRISGFNESLWRQFGEDDCASVYVLVTHGLMTRVFLMKWYHWSVEYFEDLRNIEHCEFIIMKKNEAGKYILQNKLRTWSELRADVDGKTNSASDIPAILPHKWGGCISGCDHTPRTSKSQRRQSLLMRSTSDAQTQTETDAQAEKQAEKQAAAQPAAEKSDAAALGGPAHVLSPEEIEGASSALHSPSSQPHTMQSQSHITSKTMSFPRNSTSAPQSSASQQFSPLSLSTDKYKTPEGHALPGTTHSSSTHSPSSPLFPEGRFSSASPRVAVLATGRDFGGSRSGVSSPEPFISDAEADSGDDGDHPHHHTYDKSRAPQSAPLHSADRISEDSSRLAPSSVPNADLSRQASHHRPKGPITRATDPTTGATSLARSSSASSPVEIEDLRRRMQLSGMDPGAQADALGDHIAEQYTGNSGHAHFNQHPSHHAHSFNDGGSNSSTNSDTLHHDSNPPANATPDGNKATFKTLQELEDEDKSIIGSIY
ncbi:phosphoglycerate mutase-like protein [Xylona heveae TC161]|uniref:Phosphoglycerate mutase-like protein n=1 Tax=Xylona heveae (strain CBS 132557 / TC161) TaxID=1328760 RepID=A0A165IS02_XYLHT|nr:phosphoglycerate mutase-like protein [Xylona heveae TC161]KZF25301.1 phosphoglycerate mutase-like protein [Xylona heveae TC161]